MLECDLGESGGLTSITGVHICNELEIMRVQVGDHICVAHHVTT